ncbi:hypothetical protein RRG08_028147 [Elysia crispata]|uniref:PH domain-containing protein n=1 Tax=Elysia crispata TaxID=231223 RepID=A0AAE0YY42_9GAST|nr:hypothetical protein RRG08_028147 [Elysia crispata]
MEGDRMSLSSMGSRHQFERPGADIRKTGFLKKLKSHRPQTQKKKFFVLRSTSASGPARLEYYDSEKKFKSGSPPKRSIQLHTCFNINRRSDPSVYGGSSSSSGGKHSRCGFVLHLNDESFTVFAENDEELEAWLSMLLDYQNEYLPDGDMCREHYGLQIVAFDILKENRHFCSVDMIEFLIIPGKSIDRFSASQDSSH